MWKNPDLHILGLDKKEKDLLSLLQDPLSIQELSKKSPLPRTSIAYILQKLIKRKFVEKVRIGKRYKYYSIPLERLREMLEIAYIPHEKVDAYVAPQSTPTTSKKISCYRGLKNLVRLQAEFLSSHHDTRIRAIQPNKSWLALHSKTDDSAVIHVNQIIRNNNLIVEGILEQDAYKIFNETHKNRRNFIKLAKSFGDRMADYTFAPSGYMTDQVEMWIIKNSAIFIDWRDEVAIKIVDDHMVHFLSDLFDVMKIHGRKLDHNQAIREVLDR